MLVVIIKRKMLLFLEKLPNIAVRHGACEGPVSECLEELAGPGAIGGSGCGRGLLPEAQLHTKLFYLYPST